MANFCSNSLLVRGPESSLRQLYDDCGGSFSFGAFFPVPDELQGTSATINPGSELLRSLEALTAVELPESLAPSNWYEWRIANWGTQSEIEEALEETDISAGGIQIWFTTAWRPPDKFCKQLSEKYPDLEVEFAFAESGLGFHGAATFRAGASKDEFRTIRIGSVGGYEFANLPAVQGQFWAEKPDDMDEDEWDDLDEEDRMTPELAAHLDKYSLGTGG